MTGLPPRPSDQLDLIRAGKLHPDKASLAVRSWLRFFTWRTAEEVVRDGNYALVPRLPDGIRQMVEADIKTLSLIAKRSFTKPGS